MTPQEIITAIATVGFPAALCVYFVTRFEATLKELRDAVREMTIVCRACERRTK